MAVNTLKEDGLNQQVCIRKKDFSSEQLSSNQFSLVRFLLMKIERRASANQLTKKQYACL